MIFNNNIKNIQNKNALPKNERLTNTNDNFPISFDEARSSVLSYKEKKLSIRLYFSCKDTIFFNRDLYPNREIFDVSLINEEVSLYKEQLELEKLSLSNQQIRILKIKDPIKYLKLFDTKYLEKIYILKKISFSKEDILKNKNLQSTKDKKKLIFSIDFNDIDTSNLDDDLLFEVSNDKINFRFTFDYVKKLNDLKNIESKIINNIHVASALKLKNIYNIYIKPINPFINKAEIFVKTSKYIKKLDDVFFEEVKNTYKKDHLLPLEAEEIRVVYYNTETIRTNNFISIPIKKQNNLLNNIKDDVINIVQNFDDSNKNQVDISINNIDNKVFYYKMVRKCISPKQILDETRDKIVLFPEDNIINYTDTDDLKPFKTYRYYFESFDRKSNLLSKEEYDIEIENNVKCKVNNILTTNFDRFSKSINVSVNTKTDNLENVSSRLFLNKNTNTTGSVTLSTPNNIDDQRLNRFFSKEEEERLFIDVVEEIDENGNIISANKILSDNKNVLVNNTNNLLRLKTVSINKNFLDPELSKFFHPSVKRGILGIPQENSRFLEHKDPLLAECVNSIKIIKSLDFYDSKRNSDNFYIENITLRNNGEFKIISWDFSGDIQQVDKINLIFGNNIIQCIPNFNVEEKTYMLNIKSNDLFNLETIQFQVFLFDKKIITLNKNLIS